MLIPLPRPDSSTQVLRYRGTLEITEERGAYVNGEIPNDPDIVGSTFVAWVRFALYNPLDLTDTTRRLPSFVYDDSQPASEVPHSPVACPNSTPVGIFDTDLSLNRYSWAQNLEIHVAKIDANVLRVDNAVAIDSDGANGAQALLDTATVGPTFGSGLATGTGLPVIAVQITGAVTQGGDAQAIDIDITFEIRHTNHR